MGLFGIGESFKIPPKTLAEASGVDPIQASFKITSTSGARHGRLPPNEPIGSAHISEDHITHASKLNSFIRDGSPGSLSEKGDSHGHINGEKIYGEIKRMGLGREFAETENGQKWTRKGNKPWTKLDTNAQELNIQPVILAVTRKRQIEKADHWCLFVGEEGSPGKIYQVIGDHLYMLFDAKIDINIFASASFRDTYIINNDINEHQQARVAQLAENTAPPQAPSLRDITENCQTWIVKVLWQLQKEGIVSESKIHYVESLLSPI